MSDHKTFREFVTRFVKGEPIGQVKHGEFTYNDDTIWGYSNPVAYRVCYSDTDDNMCWAIIVPDRANDDLFENDTVKRVNRSLIKQIVDEAKHVPTTQVFAVNSKLDGLGTFKTREQDADELQKMTAYIVNVLFNTARLLINQGLTSGKASEQTQRAELSMIYMNMAERIRKEYGLPANVTNSNAA